MNLSIVAGLLIPFLGTTAGAACVFFLKKQIGGNIQRIFTGFAAGVMVAASVWSLLIPAMDMCEEMGKLAFLPAVIGFLIGIVFLLFIDSMVPHLHVGSDAPEGHKSSLNRTAMLMLAVTIHNFPEGAACGAIFAGVLNGEPEQEKMATWRETVISFRNGYDGGSPDAGHRYRHSEFPGGSHYFPASSE